MNARDALQWVAAHAEYAHDFCGDSNRKQIMAEISRVAVSGLFTPARLAAEHDLEVAQIEAEGAARAERRICDLLNLAESQKEPENAK